jgi:hypothetical protein
VRCGRRAGHIPQLLLVPPTFLANSWIRIRSETPVTLQFRSCQKSKPDAAAAAAAAGMQCIHHIVPQKHSFQNWGEEKKRKKAQWVFFFPHPQRRIPTPGLFVAIPNISIDLLVMNLCCILYS